jgi:hypothetical protein
MKIGGWRSTVLALGLLVCSPQMSLAAADEDDATLSAMPETAGPPMALDKYTRHSSHRPRSRAHHRLSKVAPKSSPDKKADNVAHGSNATTVPPAVVSPPVVPLGVANAYAQMKPTDTPVSENTAPAARANDILQPAPGNPANAQPTAETRVVAADQLNELDRTLQASKPVAAKLAMASAETVATGANDESSAWARTSLMGRIFIGLGALLTMASAARMFMA